MTIWMRVFISEAAAALVAGLVIILCSRGCVPDVMAQSFTVDVDYQLQRQYKGPLLKHEVFTNAVELAAYVGGGAQSRAYAGQIVVLVVGGAATAYALEPEGSGLAAKALGGVVEGETGDWSLRPAGTNVDMGGHSVTGAADVVTAGGASLADTAALAAGAYPASNPDGFITAGDVPPGLELGETGDTAYRGDWGAAASNLAAGAVQPNHTGDVAVSGTVAAGRLVAPGVYDERGRSVAGIAVDSAVRFDAGKVWEEVAGNPAAGLWSAIEWSPKLGLFAAVSSSTIAYSRNGVGWTFQPTPVTLASGIAWAPEIGRFVVVTDSSRGVGLSDDGMNWTMAPAPPEGNMRAVAWSPQLRLLVAVGAFRIATSADGLTWTNRPSTSTLWNDIRWVPELGLFVASSSGVGAPIGISADGVQWTYPTVPANYFLSVDWSPELGMLVAVGSRGGTYASVIVSSDGVAWTGVPSAPKAGWSQVRWSSEARCFVAVSYGGEVMRSKDGFNWTLQPVPVANEWRALGWSPLLRMFVAGGASGKMILSVVDEDVSVGSLTVDGAISATGGMSVGGNVQMGTAYGTNTIAGDTQIGNSERLLEINQKGLAIIDAVSEEVEFAVEQYGAGLWRVDLRGNPVINIARLVFPQGDRLQGNGTNLFYVTAAGVTNQITANP